eukprot:gb/GEZN01018980.1/.p1 GENE.gb/GEZN01018980.1/~~gb/GEZN01018980.1/.p1  ORF type:complete len:117 (+),score=7.14 gb/GEZN01018980.1/:263-613(+)
MFFFSPPASPTSIELAQFQMLSLQNCILPSVWPVQLSIPSYVHLSLRNEASEEIQNINLLESLFGCKLSSVRMAVSEGSAGATDPTTGNTEHSKLVIVHHRAFILIRHLMFSFSKI